MKLPRILLLTALATSIAAAAASPAAAQTSHYFGPQPYGYMYTYYISGQLVSTQYMGCDGWEHWDGYNGWPDLTLGDSYDYVEWEC
ncbi:hypothetical protein [Brevundimonas sp.]|uniref:hypothetical protein n=1 Tax=Brevundimonas sp. TaxID=1871086 RepID=UPI003F709834